MGYAEQEAETPRLLARIEELEKQNAELVEALEKLENWPLNEYGERELPVRCVHKIVREALAKARGEKQ